MYEGKHKKVISKQVFIRRMVIHILLGFSLIAVALFIGISGYHWIAELNWVDSLLEASMILGGMGPIKLLKTTGAKIFASQISC
jgi:hypothetical protein